MLATNIKSIDSFCPKIGKVFFPDYPLAKFVLKYKKKSTLYSAGGGKTDHFTTGKFRLSLKRQIPVDSLLRSIQKEPQKCHSEDYLFIYREARDRYLSLKNYFIDYIGGHTSGISPIKMWNLSVVSALIFGMFLMTFIYRYLGQGASARSDRMVSSALITTQTEKVLEEKLSYPGLVLGEEDKKDLISQEEADNYVAQIIQQYQNESKNQEKLQKKITQMVKGYPIEKMIPYISKEDPIVAAFLIGIAKKESNWGKRVPVLNGQDCLNYWGYRGIRRSMGTGGHTCFDSPQDAVNTVAKRLRFLVSNEKLDTPAKMVVWKCGYDCSWDSPSAIKKWISDVDMYFSEFEGIES
jgi:polyhydroxyalkanoate synthesis regulator phasin